MTFPPIVARELKVASRRSATYWSRISFALALVVVTGLTLTLTGLEGMTASRMGQSFFSMLVSLTFMYCITTGIWITADCISSEKREGTLGFLFLTDLKGRDVILGKLAATSLRAFYGLLAMVPLMAIVFLLGGVSRGEVTRFAVVLPNVMFFSLTAGVLVSTLSQQERSAGSWTLLLIGLFTGGLPLLGVAYAGYLEYHDVHVTREVMVPFLFLSPGYGAFMATDMAYSTAPRLFWFSVAAVHGLAWAFLLLAGICVERAWQDRPATRRRATWKERFQRWGHGNPQERVRFRTRLLNINAYFWLASRNRLKAAYVWFFLGMLFIIWLRGYTQTGNDMFYTGFVIQVVLFIHTFLRVWLATEACRRTAEDFWNGAMELILSTRISVAELMHGQWLALTRQFFRPLLAVLVIDMALLIGGYHHSNVPIDERRQFIVTILGGMIVFVADMWALCWMGMWCGLAARLPRNAAGQAIGKIMALPWVILLSVNAIWSLIYWKLRIEFEPNLYVEIALWFVLSLANDFFWYRRSRSLLRENFRRMALRRFDPDLQPRTLWYYFGRLLGLTRSKLRPA